MVGVDYYFYTTAGNAGTSATTWQGWMFGSLLNGTGTASSSQDDTSATWQNWTVRINGLLGIPEVPEARQAREVQQAEWAVRQAKQAEEAKAATARAERLLIEHLSPAQRAAYEKDRFFEVVAAKSRYRIYRDGAVRRLGEDGREVASYCIHPDEAIPAGDLALAKKLLLEHDEAAFRRIANESLIGTRA
mgnify:CR=1 FL=1